jgi:site-specific DNA-cytosine methylase
MGASFEMIGNAVPPLFAKKLADSIIVLNDELKQAEKTF